MIPQISQAGNPLDLTKPGSRMAKLRPITACCLCRNSGMAAAQEVCARDWKSLWRPRQLLPIAAAASRAAAIPQNADRPAVGQAAVRH